MKILSVHWGMSFGGVAKYTATIERVRNLIPISLRSLCVLPMGRVVDQRALGALDACVLPVRSVIDLSWIPRVRRIIAEEVPDCVLTHGFNGHLVSLVGCNVLGRPIKRLASYHGSYHATTVARRLVEPIYNSFTNWFLRNKATAVLSVAQYCADFLVKRGVMSDKITVVHNGIPDLQREPDACATVRREWGFRPDQVLVGAASRFDPVKGLKYLLQAFSLITYAHPEARLVLIGDGAVRSALETQAIQLDIREKVLFTGMRTDVPRCLAALDIFVLPSLAEYHSIGLLEAMRAGLAIIATDVGGNIESVRDGRESLIVHPRDAVGLSAALERLLIDAEIRESIAAAARQRFKEEFIEDVMLAKTARWLQKECIR